jgi:outer membrane protein assembly factor BamE (lipoprotein component of BamABCDE complex)
MTRRLVHLALGIVVPFAAIACGAGPVKVVARPNLGGHSSEGSMELAASSEQQQTSGWTKAQVDKVKLGMSPEQAKSILGSASLESTAGKHLTIQWFVPQGQSIHMIFENNKATQKTVAGLGPVKEKLTQANIDKVKTGMNETQVSEILGPGSSESDLPNQKSIIWEDGSKHILVQIEKGKVVNKLVLKNQ